MLRIGAHRRPRFTAPVAIKADSNVAVCRKSFARVDAWLADIQQYAELHVDRVLVGCKCDMEDKRQITPEEGRTLAAAHGLTFFEASAKGNAGVAAPFDHLCTSVLERLGNDAAKGAKPSVDIRAAAAPPPAASQASCCG